MNPLTDEVAGFLESEGCRIRRRVQRKSGLLDLTSRWCAVFGGRPDSTEPIWQGLALPHAPVVEGAEAVGEYEVCGPGPVWVLIAIPKGVDAFLIDAISMPDMSWMRGCDVVVMDEPVGWTMVYTHEESVGPFFSRATWFRPGPSSSN
jgi:hypothetical protein